MPDSQPRFGQAIDPLDQSRGEQYRLLAVLLSSAPSAELLRGLAALEGDSTAYGTAITALARAASAATPAAVEREYFELFVGVGRGELLPYASFYQTGFLNERPLAEVRADLSRLGLARAADRFEPEDHLALLLEVMADLAQGQLPAEPGRQAAFFDRHLAPWAGQFFDDLTTAPSADFYKPVGTLGQLFIDIEARGFSLAA